MKLGHEDRRIGAVGLRFNQNVRPVNLIIAGVLGVHLEAHECDISASVLFVDRPSENGFDDASVVGHQLLCAGDEALCWIAWPPTAVLDLLGEGAEGAGICQDASWLPTLQFLVILREFRRRKPETIEPADVEREVTKPIQEAVARHGVKMMTPQKSNPATLWYADSIQIILSST